MGTAVAKRTATAVKIKPIADVVSDVKRHLYEESNAVGRVVKHRVAAHE